MPYSIPCRPRSEPLRVYRIRAICGDLAGGSRLACVVWTEAPDRERRGVAWSGDSPVPTSRRVAAEDGGRSASTGAEDTSVAALWSARAGTGEAGGTLCSLLGLVLFVCMRMCLFSRYHAYALISMYTCLHVHMFLCTCLYLHMYMFLCTSLCMYR